MHKSNVEDFFLLLGLKAGADRSGAQGKAERSFKVQYLVSIIYPTGKMHANSKVKYHGLLQQEYNTEKLNPQPRDPILAVH